MECSSPRWSRNSDDSEQPYEMDVSGWIRTEFRSANLGDERLSDRLLQIGDALGSSPAESIPNACEDWASTKATYRFCDNESVDSNEILAAHKQAQRSRIRGADELLVISDTTELVFPSYTSKEGLGDIGNSNADLEGVKVHSTIGVLPRTRRMTGVIDQQVLIEDQRAGTKHETNPLEEPTELANEQEKWIRGDRRARNWLADSVRPIFIHDRGADAFRFHKEVADDMENAGFVVRANQNRRIRTTAGKTGKLFDWSRDLPEQGRTTIEIEQNGRRDAREAELSISAGQCQLLPPRNNPGDESPVEVSVVRVDELNQNDDPIQWVLLTTESVETREDVLTIIEYYSLRWRIEEWHKVLKSGCRIEDRRLQTWDRMEVLLSVYSVIAWKVLGLRELARQEESIRPESLLTETERTVLETKFPELPGQDGQAYAIAVAKIGGYLDRSSDPPPGWETMWKGLKKLRTWAEGYELHS